MCSDERVVGIESIVRYFLGIVGILGFRDFLSFLVVENTLFS